MEEPACRRVRFNILGSLESWAGDHRLRLGGPIQERVLTALLLESGRVVPVSRLVEVAWDDDPPATAAHQVRKTVADLRRRIPDGAEVIVTDGSGYRVVIADEQLDLKEFGVRTRQARESLASGRSAEAAQELRAALALWRGPVMSWTCGSVLSAASAALEERRLSVAEQLFELRLCLGETVGLVGDLRELVGAHPLRETLRGQLMLALYRSGRQAEALEEYGKVRRTLADELGINPGLPLTDLYEAILRGSPELVAPEPPASAPPTPAFPLPAGAEAPCTLPHCLTDFIGREQEQQRLLEVPDPDEQGSRIVAIDGMGGCGKTSLAVRAAHQLASRYPDGQLYIDLRGYTPGEQPLQPGTALEALLWALGIPGDWIPDNEEGRFALWRATLANRRVLLLFDNAFDSAQIRPLLPGSAGCLVLVTSRARLVGLDGAEWFSIGMMPPEDSARLLAETLGKDRIAAEPEAAARLAELCGHLPLALRLATARLRNRSHWTVRYLVDRLRDDTHRLDELTVGDRSVAATLQLSYLAMEEQHRTAFRLLGLHPGAEIDIYSTAALLGTSTRDAENILEQLLDTHLVQQHRIGLYAFHDLVRSYAQSLRDPSTRETDHAAVERWLDCCLATTEKACDMLFPGRMSYATGLTVTVAELPELRDSDSALEWFDRERGTLLAAISLAHEWGLDRQTVHLARNVVFHLNLRSHFEEFQEVGYTAVAAARRLQEPLALRMSLSNLSAAWWKLGRFQDGINASEEALDIARRIGDRKGEAFCLDSLGNFHMSLGHLQKGQRYLDQGIALHRETGNTQQEATALCNLSSVCTWLGRHAEATAAAERAGELYRRLGDRDNEIAALNDLAIACLETDESEKALACLDLAVELGDETRMPENLALTLALSVDAWQRTGQTEKIPGYVERALALVRSKGTVMLQAAVENIIGVVHRRRGEYAKAVCLHENAYRYAKTIGYRIEEARALSGLAEAVAAQGDLQSAEDHRLHAEELFDAMRVPQNCRQRA